MSSVFRKLPRNKLHNSNQNISVLKQNSPIKLTAISRVANSIKAFLRSRRQTCSMEMVFFQWYPCKFNLEPSLPAELLFPSARDHTAALPLHASSTKATQFSPFVFYMDQSAEKPTQKDRLQLL